MLVITVKSSKAQALMKCTYSTSVLGIHQETNSSTVMTKSIQRLVIIIMHPFVI